MSNETLIGNKTILLTARQAVLDTGSSVITTSTIDANAINSVSPHLRFSQLLFSSPERVCAVDSMSPRQAYMPPSVFMII